MLSTSNEETLRGAVAVREDDTQGPPTRRTTPQGDRSHDLSTWRWRVEPGKEDDFEYLRAWLLWGAREAPAESVSPPDQAQKMPAERGDAGRRRESLATARQPSLVRGGARLAGEALSRAGRRLLQWSGEPA